LSENNYYYVFYADQYGIWFGDKFHEMNNQSHRISPNDPILVRVYKHILDTCKDKIVCTRQKRKWWWQKCIECHP